MSVGQLATMLQTASTCARLCNALYGRRAGIVDLAGQLGARFRYTTVGFGSAAVIEFDGTAYVAIGGSDDAYDWVQNLSARLDLADNNPMHLGWKSSAIIISQELIDDGAMKLIEGNRLVLCGHSSGGAMAAAISSPVIAPRFNASEVYTFGAPRVFSPQVAARYAAAAIPTYRFVMYGDPVPCLPTTVWRRELRTRGY
jgi:predicted lipase